MAYGYDPVAGGVGAAGGAATGALAGAAWGAAGGPIGAGVGALVGAGVGLLGGIQRKSETHMNKDMIALLQKSRSLMLGDARRLASNTRARAGQAMVSRGLANTTVPNQIGSEIDRALNTEMQRINQQINMAISGEITDIQYEGSPFSDAIKMFGYWAGTKLSQKGKTTTLGTDQLPSLDLGTGPSPVANSWDNYKLGLGGIGSMTA